jgi:hypothetical protein
MTARFESLCRYLATRVSRRAALGTAGAGAIASLAGSLGLDAAAHDATPAPEAVGDDESFLFVQTATSGSFTRNPAAGTPAANGTPTPGGGADYVLTLEGHHGGTIYFSDRPKRVVGDAPTQEFLDGLGFTPHNPPNAALVTETDSGEEDIIVLELTSPTYDDASSTLTYGATILDVYQGDGLTHLAQQQVDDQLPESFGRTSLFIDDCPVYNQCLFLAVMHVEPMGPIPGGPYATCWDEASNACVLCDETVSDLRALCNDTYPACDGVCVVG